VQSDPIGLDGGMSTFGYANGSPTLYSDPEGLFAGYVARLALRYVLPRIGLQLAARTAVRATPRALRQQLRQVRRVGANVRCDLGTLRSRVNALGTDPARGFIRAEGVGGVRIEKLLGRNIRRSTDEAADFIDDVLGPISLKGPIPSRGSVEGLASSVIKDANFNTATRALFVDLRGLSASQQGRVRGLIESGTNGVRKQIFFLE
jgi:hypothetical protein